MFFKKALAMAALIIAACQPTDPKTGKLVLVTQNKAPVSLAANASALLKVTLANQGEGRALGSVRFTHAGGSIDKQVVELSSGESKTYTFTIRPTKPGQAAYTADVYQGLIRKARAKWTLTVLDALDADLGLVSAAVSPLQALSGATVQVAAVVRNWGPIAVFGAMALEVSGVTVGTITLPVIEPGAEFTVSEPLLVTGNGSGPAVVRVSASAPDTDATNDALDVGQFTLTAPDWSLMTYGPVQVLPNAPYNVTGVVQNVTLFDLPATVVHFYSTYNASLDKSVDHFEAALAVPPLTAGQSWAFSQSLVGYANAVTDYNVFGVVQDEITANNVSQTSIDVLTTSPDFAVSNVTSSTTTFYSGAPVFLHARVRNAGNTAAAATVWYTLNGTQNYSLWKGSLGSINQNANIEHYLSLNMPVLANGTYALRVTADPDLIVSESDESNNSASAAQSYVVAPDRAASVTNFTPMPSPATGVIRLTVQWTNNGNPAPATTAAVWMALTTKPNEGAPDFITQVAAPALASMASVNVNYDLTPLRGKGAYAWVVSAASVPGEVNLVNNRHRSVGSQVIQSALALAWSDTVTDSVISSPAWASLTGDSVLDVIIGGGAGYYYGKTLSVNGADGAVLSTQLQGADVMASAAVADLDADTSVDYVIGGQSGSVYAFTATGDVKWSKNFGTRWVASPALADFDGDAKPDVVITAGGWPSFFSAGTMAVLKGTDGTFLWGFDESLSAVPVEYRASPAIADLNTDGSPDVIVGAGSDSANGFVAAIDGVTHLKLWSLDTVLGVTSSPVVTYVDADAYEDVVYATMSGYGGAINGLTGAALWQSSTLSGYQIVSSPAVGDIAGTADREAVFMAGRGVFPLYDRGLLWALDVKTGVEKWRYPYGTGSGSSPILADIDGDGKSEILVTFLGNNTDPYAASEDTSKLFVFTGAGVLKDVFDFPGQGYSTPALIDLNGNGTWNLIFGSSVPGNLFNVETSYSSGNAAEWPKYRGNLRNTGRHGD